MLRLNPAIGSGGIAACRDVPSRHGDSRVFFGLCAMLFVAGAAVTILCHGPMANAEPGLGGWTLPGAWDAMCGTSPSASAATFLVLWSAMTLAMMLPSFAPALWRWRVSLAAGRTRWLAGAVAMAGLGYFVAWSVVGLCAFAASHVAAIVVLREPGVVLAFPIVGGAVVTLAGALQFSAWKARHLDACRGWPACSRGGNASLASAWRHGLNIGRHCVCSCAGWTTALLVGGSMDLGAMTLATVAITAERLAADGKSAARIGGAIAVGLGLARLASAAVLAWR